MIRRGIFLLSALSALACSSSGDDESGSNGNGGNTGSGTGGTGTMFGTGGTGTAGSSTIGTEELERLRGMACAGETAATEPFPSILQLVVDVSGSMDDEAPGSNRSKWEETRDALDAAIRSLPAGTAVGVLYYPNMETDPSEPEGDQTDAPRDPSACVNTDGGLPVDLLGPPDGPHRMALLDSLQNVNGPQGGTPTHDAYRIALAGSPTYGGLNSSTLPGDRFMLIITDGQPTFLDGCRGTGNVSDAVDPQPIVFEVESAINTGVRTFVIGSPGSEQVGVPVFDDARTWLSMAASIGGTATPNCNDNGPNFCHFDMTQESNFSDALRRALGAIVGQVVSCSYFIPAPPDGQDIDRSRVNVVYTPESGMAELVPQAADATCAEGWQYSADGSSVELCESTCNRIQQDSAPVVELLFGCETTVAIQ